jgi:hypothetical protein
MLKWVENTLVLLPCQIQCFLYNDPYWPVMAAAVKLVMGPTTILWKGVGDHLCLSSIFLSFGTLESKGTLKGVFLVVVWYACLLQKQPRCFRVLVTPKLHCSVRTLLLDNCACQYQRIVNVHTPPRCVCTSGPLRRSWGRSVTTTTTSWHST